VTDDERTDLRRIVKDQAGELIAIDMFTEAEKRGLQLTNKELYNRASSMRNALKHAKDPTKTYSVLMTKRSPDTIVCPTKYRR
jgi:hypothetical protein